VIPVSAFAKIRAATEYAAQHGRSGLTQPGAVLLLKRLDVCEAVLADRGGQLPVMVAGLLRGVVLAARELAGPTRLEANGEDPDVAAFIALLATASPPDPARIDEICSWLRSGAAVPPRDRMAPGRDHCIESAVELVQPRSEPESGEEIGDLLVGGVWRAEAQVRAQRDGEERGLLGAPRHQRPDLLGRQGNRIVAVDGESACGEVDEPQQGEHDRGLAAAARPGQRDRTTRRRSRYRSRNTGHRPGPEGFG
jgi:hypothetical protein